MEGFFQVFIFMEFPHFLEHILNLHGSIYIVAFICFFACSWLLTNKLVLPALYLNIFVKFPKHFPLKGLVFFCLFNPFVPRHLTWLELILPPLKQLFPNFTFLLTFFIQQDPFEKVPSFFSRLKFPSFFFKSNFGFLCQCNAGITLCLLMLATRQSFMTSTLTQAVTSPGFNVMLPAGVALR